MIKSDIIRNIILQNKNQTEINCYLETAIFQKIRKYSWKKCSDIYETKKCTNSAGSDTLRVRSWARLIIQLNSKTEPSVAKAHNYTLGGHHTEKIRSSKGRGGYCTSKFDHTRVGTLHTI